MNNIFLVILATSLSLILITPFVLDSFAQESNLQCSEERTLVYRIISEKYACLKPSTADKWYEDGIAEPVKQIVSSNQEIIDLQAKIATLEEKIIEYNQEKEISNTNLENFKELEMTAFNQRDFDRINDLFVSDVQIFQSGSFTNQGKVNNYLAELKLAFNIYPDLEVVEQPVLFSSGNWTASLSIYKGTWLNPIEILGGRTLEPTEKPFEIEIITLAKWEEGKIVEEHILYDNEDWMNQIGLEN